MFARVFTRPIIERVSRMAGLRFKSTMDQHSVDVERADAPIHTGRLGMVQWHPDSRIGVRFVTTCDMFTEISLPDMEAIVERMRKAKNKEIVHD